MLVVQVLRMEQKFSCMLAGALPAHCIPAPSVTSASKYRAHFNQLFTLGLVAFFKTCVRTLVCVCERETDIQTETERKRKIEDTYVEIREQFAGV